MDFDTIKDEYEKDIVWDFNKLDKYLQTLPITIAKYQNYWFRYKKAYDKLENEYNDSWIGRFTYYKHEFDVKLSNSEIKEFLNKDIELNKVTKKMKGLLTSLEWIEKALKNLDNIRWDISRVMEYEKFKSGSF